MDTLHEARTVNAVNEVETLDADPNEPGPVINLSYDPAGNLIGDDGGKASIRGVSRRVMFPARRPGVASRGRGPRRPGGPRRHRA